MAEYSREEAIAELDVHYETYRIDMNTYGIEEKLGAPNSTLWPQYLTPEDATTELQKRHGDGITIREPVLLGDDTILPGTIFKVGDPIFQVTTDDQGNMEIIPTTIDERDVCYSTSHKSGCDYAITYYANGISFTNQNPEETDPASAQARMSGFPDCDRTNFFPTIESLDNWIKEQKAEADKVYRETVTPLLNATEQLKNIVHEQSFTDQLELENN